ncbi:hypothetical protein AB3S75_017916 [Citrus x aurantiifolia]
MLSVEKTPSDPSCSCQFPQLNATCNSDDKASPKVVVDLLNTQTHDHDHHHLPKFSIRDYVFTSRSKDIKKNWPFSLKNLQLCLKHGVKEVLPPFQTHSAVKTQSIRRCAVETEKKSVANFDAEPSEPNNKEVLDSSGNAQLNDKLENACLDTSSCRSAGENEFPSTTTSVSHSDIESVPTKRPSSSSLETDPLLEASASASATAEVRAAGHPTTRPPGKKCRLIVKFGGNSDRSSTEDIASNSTAVSETMASKVCPVCKTFTSSSNTTLNAHIDQCLSAESTPKWTADSRPTRHRIKPRKTRLMVDIYATAKHCTLEELDRRNGTSWATVSSLPTQDTEKHEMPAEWKRPRVSQVHPEDAGDVGEVYIDANGTKVRILSKPNDAAAASKELEHFQPKNPLKGCKGSKFFSKKKKRHARKQLKYLKLAPQSRKFFSHKARASQICGGQEGDYGVEEGNKKEKHQRQKQTKSGDSGALRQWVCSKRTGLTKKVNNQDNRKAFRCKWHLPQELLIDSEQSSLGESLTVGNHIEKYGNLSENLPSSSGTSVRGEKPFYEVQVSDKSGRKKVGCPSFGAKVSDNTERSRLPMKQNSHLNRDNPIIHDCRTSDASSLTNKRASVPGGLVDIPPSGSTTPCMNSQVFASTSIRVISRKTRSTVFKSNPNREKKFLAGKMTRLELIRNVDEEVAAWGSEVGQQYALNCMGGRKEINDETPFGKSILRGMIQDRGAMSTEGEEIMALESSEQAPQFYGHDDGENTDASARAGDDVIDKVDVLESVEDAVATVDTKFEQLSDRSRTRSNSFEDYNGILCGGEALTGPTEPSFVDGQEMYSSDEAGNGIIGQNDQMGPGLDSDIGEGNSFPEVDPIPIPGPPGSFLPSPRDMGSDDFQGNSSLTTSRVQSSQDQLDLVDGDTSDSPISVASTVSNSTAVRSDFSPLSSAVHAVQDKLKPGLSSGGGEPLVENAAVVAQTGTGAERSYFDGEKFKVNKISIEKRTSSFKNDGQPCCCQRKERISQDVAQKYQESQLLKRRTMTSVTLPAIVKQNVKPNNLDVRPEIFSLGSCPNFVSEKIVPPTMKSSASPISVKGSPETGVKFSGHGDCDSPSPSTPNPVLRLMGKNLMVVNKEEDASVPLGQSQPCAQNSHLISQLPTSSRFSPGSMQNQDCHYFPQMGSQGPVIFSHNPYDAAGQSFDARLPSSFRNQTNPRTPQTSAQVPSGLFPNQHVNGGFTAPMEPHMYGDAYSLSSRHDRLKFRQSETSSYVMGNVVTSLDRPHKSADCGASQKEIIVIDDIPESEANASADVTKYSEGLRASQLMSSGISIPKAPNFNPRHVNHFSCYQARDHPPVLGESPAVHNSNFPAIPKLPNASPVRWVCTQEGSTVLQRGPFAAAPPAASHVRSGPYYSPSLS